MRITCGLPTMLPLEKGMALHLNKFESSSPMDALCQDWLKLAQWFSRNLFSNFINVFLRMLFRNYLFKYNYDHCFVHPELGLE